MSRIYQRDTAIPLARGQGRKRAGKASEEERPPTRCIEVCSRAGITCRENIVNSAVIVQHAQMRFIYTRLFFYSISKHAQQI